MPKTNMIARWFDKKTVAFSVLAIILAVVVIGSTIAFLIVVKGPLNNVFSPPNLDISISGNQIKNDGDVPVYVRATIVVNWVDESGAIWSTAPIPGIDYAIETYTTESDNWFLGSDGFYYYKNPLEVNQTTHALIKSSEKIASKDGYTLQVQILSSAIQTTPTNAVSEAWPAVKVDSTAGNTLANN